MNLPRSTNKILIGIFFALILNAFGGIAAGSSTENDVAIRGYDSVSYFVDGEAKKGDEEFTHQWHGMTWYFSSKENRNLFAANPEKYAPQYDGYCAWAMTEERKAETDPEVWRIVNGRLYLNCSEAAYEKWSRDIPGNINKADKNWSTFKKNTN
mgnify:CR=1 FL=1